MSGRSRTRTGPGRARVRGHPDPHRPGGPPAGDQYGTGRGKRLPGERRTPEDPDRPGLRGTRDRPGTRTEGAVAGATAGPSGVRTRVVPGAVKDEKGVEGLTTGMEEVRIRPGGGRPRRVPDWQTRTRPAHIKDKTGKSGVAIQVITNHCMLRSVPGHSIYQFNVSYKPPIESRNMRTELLKQQITKLNLQVRVFDGMILYLPIPLEADPMVVTSHCKDGTPVELTFKLTNKVSANSPTCLQLLNSLFRRFANELHAVVT